jgi:hypothetical protein
VPNASHEWPPKTLARIPLGFVPRPAERTLELTEEQIGVAERLALTHRAILDGPPGSGKTHLAAAVATGYAKLGRRVLVASPRKPLAMWLRQALQPYGIAVQTIDGCAREVLKARWSSPPTRRGFDDPDFFFAAADAVEADRYDLVFVDEWQTTTASEQYFMHTLAGQRALIRMQDSSRDLRDVPPAVTDHPEVLVLSESLRSPDRVGRLDLLYAQDGLDPVPSDSSAASVSVMALSDPAESLNRVQEAVAAFRKGGLGLGDIGVASAIGRAQSGLLTAMCSPSLLSGRGFHLTDAPALGGLACDSFSYWLGLERRAMIVTEAPAQLSNRRRRLHIAISRACESVHFVLSNKDVETDETLSAWMRGPSAAGAGPALHGRPDSQ